MCKESEDGCIDKFHFWTNGENHKATLDSGVWYARRMVYGKSLGLYCHTQKYLCINNAVVVVLET